MYRAFHAFFSQKVYTDFFYLWTDLIYSIWAFLEEKYQLSTNNKLVPTNFTNISNNSSTISNHTTLLADLESRLSTIESDYATESSVTALDTRMTAAEGSITTLESISSENIYTDYNGAIATRGVVTLHTTIAANYNISLADGSYGDWVYIQNSAVATDKYILTVNSASWNGGSSASINFTSNNDQECSLHWTPRGWWCSMMYNTVEGGDESHLDICPIEFLCGYVLGNVTTSYQNMGLFVNPATGFGNYATYFPPGTIITGFCITEDDDTPPAGYSIDIRIGGVSKTTQTISLPTERSGYHALTTPISVGLSDLVTVTVKDQDTSSGEELTLLLYGIRSKSSNF
jgi:hypothetical protein